MKLVKIAYGDDLRDKSVSEAEGLLRTYPNLKCIIAPTTVGIAAAGKVLTDKGLKGKVFLTGLGLPSEMATYIENGVCPYMFLWNPIDVGYLGAYTGTALVKGTIKGAVGDKFKAGRLGDYTVVKAADGGTEILLGPPFKFDKANIASGRRCIRKARRRKARASGPARARFFALRAAEPAQAVLPGLPQPVVAPGPVQLVGEEQSVVHDGQGSRAAGSPASLKGLIPRLARIPHLCDILCRCQERRNRSGS